jgi:SAM-dependent methyltransferase
MDQWREYHSHRARAPYWHNVLTGETTWKRPLPATVQYGAKPPRELGAAEPEGLGGVRRFHSWIKAVIIEEAATLARETADGALRVVDLACGRGGDLLKFRALGEVVYRGVDASAEALEAAEARAATMDGQRCTWHHSDMCNGAPLLRLLGANSADVCTCMFGPHFAYRSPESARAFIETVRGLLRPGGVFACIFPSGTAIEAALAQGGGKALYRPLFALAAAQAGTIDFTVHGATPTQSEPLLPPGRLRTDLIEAGLEVVVDATLRELRTRFAHRSGQRHAMHCPETLDATQWELSDLQHVLVVRSAAPRGFSRTQGK